MRHTVHESLDFNPKGNRAERVQTVNVAERIESLMESARAALWLAQRLLGHLLDIDAGKG